MEKSWETATLSLTHVRYSFAIYITLGRFRSLFLPFLFFFHNPVDMAASCHRISTGNALSTDANSHIQAKRNRRLSSESQFLSTPNQWQRGGIVLTTSRRRWLIEAVPPVERFEDDGGEEKRKLISTVCSYALQDKQDVVGDEDAESVENVDRDWRRRRTEVAVAAVVTMALGVGNRVLYKLALVPLKKYPFFLAQLATFGYHKPIPLSLSHTHNHTH